MDRDRLIAELASQGITTDKGRLRVIDTLGRGGNGVAFLCQGDTVGEIVAKVYVPPDKRDLDDQALARFRNEVKLTSTIRHPNVIPAIGSGTAELGAYVLPYYLMPQAASTLRSIIGHPPNVEEIQRVARLFLEVCLGVSCLHTHGIVHRDLKPENVLISRDGSAWVADLGIAHIDPDFVSVGLRTMVVERLMNRDYYAPEQRFGSAAEVDARADIYALGCILYEVLVGTPPVRRDSPPVASVNSAFAVLDPVIDRMTSYEPGGRYQHIEAAIVDVALAFGWVTSTMRGARQPEPADVKEMIRLLRSSNGARRSAGVSLAQTLGEAALFDLHDLMGHGRREVRNAAADSLGQIADESSIPYLVAGLQGNSRKPGSFRPSVDTASQALSHYSPQIRTAVLNELTELINPRQTLEILKGFDSAAAIDAVKELNRRRLILFDWSESLIDMIIEIDEDVAWQQISVEAQSYSSWSMRHRLPRLSIERQLILAREWVDRANYSQYWEWEAIVKSVTEIAAPPDDVVPILKELSQRLGKHLTGETLDKLRSLVSNRMRELEEA